MKEENSAAAGDVTRILLAWGEGDAGAAERLFPLVYDELRQIAGRYMRRERAGHTLQPTALVNEAYLRLVDQTRVRWQNRAQFFGVAATMMRRILVNHARERAAHKRGGGARRQPLSEIDLSAPEHAAELLALDEALDRLAARDERKARVVELRYFGGLENEEAAEVLGVSEKTVRDDWKLARSWLYRELSATTATSEP
jgi:RNA polymerase sigma factor (TIGR02999 family)